MTIDAPDLRASAAMEAEIENLRSSLAAVDAKCRELRSERDAARREAGALRGVCQLLVEAAFVSETQFVCPNAFEPAVRAARRALSSSRPPSSEPRITFHGSGSDLATDVAALLTTAKLRGEFLDELRRKMPVTDAFVAPPESSSRPGADPKQPVALTPEDSRRLVEEGKALRDEVRKATERMRPKGIRAPTPETKPATRDGAKEESSSRPGADLRAEGFREGIEAAANLVDLSGPATIQKAALMREIRALQPAPCDGGAGAVRKCDCGALWAPWSPLDATCGCGRRRAAPTPETRHLRADLRARPAPRRQGDRPAMSETLSERLYRWAHQAREAGEDLTAHDIECMAEEAEHLERRASPPPSRAPESDAEARLAAFVRRYAAESVRLSMSYDSWCLSWRRTYPDVVSDRRQVVGGSFTDVVHAAEEVEAENDQREPQHAAPPERERAGPVCGYCRHRHHAGIRCREGGCECLGMDGGAPERERDAGAGACIIARETTSGRCFACDAEVAPAKCATCGQMHVGTYCWPCHHKNNPDRCASPFCPEHAWPRAAPPGSDGAPEVKP